MKQEKKIKLYTYKRGVLLLNIYSKEIGRHMYVGIFHCFCEWYYNYFIFIINYIITLHAFIVSC